jgi:hypothetical protein
VNKGKKKRPTEKAGLQANLATAAEEGARVRTPAPASLPSNYLRLTPKVRRRQSVAPLCSSVVER